jgi:thioesterase domain-containing protein/malonyl CoA-acyl carrier protein transacylase/acyl carrier protein
VGIVVLKRLEEALADGDPIHAVIKGSAINNDGSTRVGYTAPSVDGQARVIRAAQVIAEIHPETITYIETHGTATSLGDPIEIAALTNAFRPNTEKKGFCAIGSVKTNIGHADSASGVAGLIKTILMLKNKLIPPSLHFEKPNPEIDFANSPFYVNSKLNEWKVDKLPRRAGVSSFGIGGTNAHVILEEAPSQDVSGKSRPWQILLLSAKTSTALDKMTTNLVGHLKQHPHLNLADVAYTLLVGRKEFNHRRMVVCQDLNDAVTQLEKVGSKRVRTSYCEAKNRDVVFMFSGQGSQYVNMGLDLYGTEPKFREQIDRCSNILQPELSFDLRDILYPKEKSGEEVAERLNQTYVTQPALFVIEYALARLWMEWGIHPQAMIGHSIGEYVAACLAGVFSLEEALSLVATRGRLMQGLPSGSMLVVPLSEKEIKPFLGNGISLAVINGPSFCVVSGEKGAMEDLKGQLSKKNFECRYLHTSHAFHSEMMEPILGVFTDRVKGVALNAPQIPFVSNVTGTWITPDEATDPGYWARHLRQTVRFSDGAQEMSKEPARVFLEVGPGNTLSTLLGILPARKKEQIVLSSLRHPKEKESDVAFILNTLGQLWLAGIQIDGSRLHADENRHRLSMPTYPFERKRYWINGGREGYAVVSAGRSSSLELDKVSGSRPTHPEKKKEDAYADAFKGDIEQTIANIWRELLGIEEVTVHDNFFHLGGTSLIGVRLFAKIEEIYGKRLPLASLFQAPTIEQLANTLRQKEWTPDWSSLVAIQPGGSKPPMFLIHGAEGNVLLYRELAHYLGPDQPVYGLQSQGLDGEREFHTCVEDMAVHYIKEIRTLQPEGPYYLGGYCLGGGIALEMAQQLHAQGQEVPLLAMFETYNVQLNLKALSFPYSSYHRLQNVKFHLENLLRLRPEEGFTFFIKKVKVEETRAKVIFNVWLSKVAHKFGADNGQRYIHIPLKKINDQAFINYVPKSYPGRLTLFRPRKVFWGFDDPKFGWESLFAEGVDVYELPVNPRGMLVEPFVQTLAEKLKASLEKAKKDPK